MYLYASNGVYQTVYALDGVYPYCVRVVYMPGLTLFMEGKVKLCDSTSDLTKVVVCISHDGLMNPTRYKR